MRATLGVALAMSGRTREGLAQLDRGAPARRTLHDRQDPVRRGHMRYFYLAQPREALADLEPALGSYRQPASRCGRPGLSTCWACVTSPWARSSRRLTRSVTRPAHLPRPGPGRGVVVTLHNRGLIAFCQGDLPRALELYDEAADEYAALGRDRHALVFDQVPGAPRGRLARGGCPGPGRDDSSRGRFRKLSGRSCSSPRRWPGWPPTSQPCRSPARPRALRLFRRQGHWWAAAGASCVVLMARHRQGDGGADCRGRRHLSQRCWRPRGLAMPRWRGCWPAGTR